MSLSYLLTTYECKIKMHPASSHHLIWTCIYLHRARDALPVTEYLVVGLSQNNKHQDLEQTRH